MQGLTPPLHSKKRFALIGLALSALLTLTPLTFALATGRVKDDTLGLQAHEPVYLSDEDGLTEDVPTEGLGPDNSDETIDKTKEEASDKLAKETLDTSISGANDAFSLGTTSVENGLLQSPEQELVEQSDTVPETSDAIEPAPFDPQNPFAIPGDEHIIAGTSKGAAKTGNLSWKLYDNGLFVLGGEGETGPTADYSPATHEAPCLRDTPWKDYQTQIKSLKIEEGVSRLGHSAFAYYTNLEYISFPSTLRSLGSFALAFTALTSVVLPEGFESVGECDSSGRSTGWVFNVCKNLQSIVFPSTLKEIGWDSFGICLNLRSVVFLGSEAPRVNLFASQEVPDDLRFYVPEGAEVSYQSILPNGGSSNTSIWNFKGERTGVSYSVDPADPSMLVLEGTGKLTSVDSLCKTLGTTKVRIASDTLSLGDAFRNNTQIESVILPENFKSIDDSAFKGCTNLTSVTMPGVTAVGDNAFKNCTSLILNSLPEGVTSVGANAFEGCKSLALTSLPTTLETVGDSAFKGCSKLTLSDLSTNLTSIGNSAFEGCSGISGNLNLPQLTTLGERAFAGCTKLTSATFSSSLNTIGEAAFAGASALQSVTINKSQAPTVTSAAGTQNPASTLFVGTQATIKVPYGTTGTTGYDANGWELERLRLSGVTYYDETGVEKIVPESEGVRVLEAYKDKKPPTLSSGWYVLNGAIGGDITFDERINVSGDVKIILSSSTLNVPKGIDVPKGSTLTVYSKQQNSPFGTIVAGVPNAGSGATSGVEAGSAAIGGSFGQDTGTINIVGGTINATGGTGAAGIGGAQGGSLGTVNVLGGTVTATGGAGACGIGAGASASSSGAGGTINVTGGSVSATGTDAPGIGTPKGSSGVLTLNVTETGHVVATNTGGGVVVGSVDAPQDVEMNIGGIIVAETGNAKSPSRDDIGCDKPTLETSGVVLVVGSVSDIEENANKSITINEHSVLLINGYEDGVEVFPNPESGQTSQKVTLTPGADSSHSIDLEPGGSLVFTNSDNKKVVITAPNTPNTTGTTNTTINLASDNQVSLPKGVTVSIEGKKLPFIVDTQQSLTLKNFGTVSDDTPVNNPQNPLEVGFDQPVSDIVAPENKVLSEEDARRYEYGFGTSVWLEVKYEVLDADKTQVEENLGASKLGQLLDISLFYKVDGRAQTQIHETATPVQVKFNIPEALLAYDPAKVKRTFKIVRVHSAATGEKEVATLDTFDGTSVVDGIATFASNKFSAFALLYEDEAIPEPVVPGENNNPAAGGSTGTGSGTGVGNSTGTGSNAGASNGSGTSGTDTSNGTSQSKGATNTESGSLFSDTGDNTPVVPLTMLLLMAVGLMGAYVYRSSTFAIKRRAKHSR